MKKYAYIQTSDIGRLIQVCLVEENDYDSLHQVEVVERNDLALHEFVLTNTLKRVWLERARRVAREAGLKLRCPDTVALR